MFDLSFGEIILALLICMLILDMDDVKSIMKEFRKFKLKLKEIKNEALDLVGEDLSEIKTEIDDVVKGGYIKGNDGKMYFAFDSDEVVGDENETK